ncbi:MAG: hypothetical protein JXA69_19625 [Phycisphaerae bacterium]|nr:hypothetical protein [Phycisphaerae bacterium]
MRTVGFLLVMSVLAWPARVLADGKVFSAATATAKTTIPDQQALIHFADDVERLVIETRFSGSGTDFVWVVPLPARTRVYSVQAIPEVRCAAPGLFREGLEPTTSGFRLGAFVLYRLSICFCLLSSEF